MRSKEEARECRAAEDDRMLMFELEAAEALARLARSSAVVGERIETGSQGQAVDTQQFSTNTSTAVAGPLYDVGDDNVTERITCSTSFLPKVGRTRQNLTQAEKEARRLGRVLANRESARRTIRRRQYMYKDLKVKADYLSKENTHLKKEKEMALKNYNFLIEKNESLRSQVTRLKAESRKQGQQNSSQPEISRNIAAATPIFLHNQPPLIPFFWPSIVPTSSDIFKNVFASNPGCTSALQSQVQTWEKHFSSDRQNCPSGTPLLLLPVPMLVPIPSQSSALECNSTITDRKKDSSSINKCWSCTSSAGLEHEDDPRWLFNKNNTEDASEQANFQSQGCSYNREPRHKALVRHGSSISSKSARCVHDVVEKHQKQPFISPSYKSGYASEAAEARRRRKALMKLKNVHNVQ